MFTKNNIHIPVVNSTNSYALSLKGSLVFKEGLVVSTDFQTNGKGQRGKVWESKPKENLMLSAVLAPNIALENQFIITKIVALAIYDFIKSLGLNAEIKWPNDILVSKQKVAGILIENTVVNSVISYSVVGIGLNVNQQEFDKNLNKASSLSILLCKELNLNIIKTDLLACLQKRVEAFRKGENQDKPYLSSLFLKDKVATFESNNQKFMGIIRGVTQQGLLRVETENETKEFNLQELKLLY